jgi:hypothetical protein
VLNKFELLVASKPERAKQKVLAPEVVQRERAEQADLLLLADGGKQLQERLTQEPMEPEFAP